MPPTSADRPSTVPATPSPGVSTTFVGTARWSFRSRASDTIACATMCLDAWSSDAATRRSSVADTSPVVRTETTRAFPSVNVPVLSMTTERMRAITSSALPPLIRIPCLAARDSPEMIATGTARMRGQGVATTRTATARMGSPVPATPHQR